MNHSVEISVKSSTDFYILKEIKVTKNINKNINIKYINGDKNIHLCTLGQNKNEIFTCNFLINKGIDLQKSFYTDSIPFIIKNVDSTDESCHQIEDLTSIFIEKDSEHILNFEFDSVLIGASNLIGRNSLVFEIGGVDVTICTVNNAINNTEIFFQLKKQTPLIVQCIGESGLFLLIRKIGAFE